MKKIIGLLIMLLCTTSMFATIIPMMKPGGGTTVMIIPNHHHSGELVPTGTETFAETFEYGKNISDEYERKTVYKVLVKEVEYEYSDCGCTETKKEIIEVTIASQEEAEAFVKSNTIFCVIFFGVLIAGIAAIIIVLIKNS